MNPYPGLVFRHLRPEEMNGRTVPEGFLICSARRTGESQWWIFYYREGELDGAVWTN